MSCKWLLVVLMGHVSVTISYLFRFLTTGTEKYVNENSFTGTSAALAQREETQQTDKQCSSHILGFNLVLSSLSREGENQVVVSYVSQNCVYLQSS